MTTTRAPVDAGRLADDLLTLEIGFTASFHDDTVAAERIEHAAAGLDLPLLALRARVARAVVMLREGDTVAGGRLTHLVYPEAVELGDAGPGRCRRCTRRRRPAGPRTPSASWPTTTP